MYIRLTNFTGYNATASCQDLIIDLDNQPDKLTSSQDLLTCWGLFALSPSSPIHMTAFLDISTVRPKRKHAISIPQL